jgi:hypothetical protein
MQASDRILWMGLVIAVALLAATWRFEGLDHRPLWLDEGHTAGVVAHAPTLAALWHTGQIDDYQHPPFAYLLPWIAARGGETPFRLRLPSALMGLASIAGIGATAALLAGRWAGLVAAFLAAISLYHIDISQQARPYMPGLALTTGQYVALFAFLLRGERRWLAAFAVCAALALYTYHLALLHVGVAAGLALLHVARSPRGRDDRRALGLVFLGLGIAYLPQAGNLAGFLSGQGAAPNHVLHATPRFFDALVQRWGSGDGATTRLYQLAFVIGAVRIAARRDLVSLGMLGWATAPLLVFATRPFSKYFDIRFLISSLPVFFVLAGAGVDAVGRGAAALVARVAPGGATRAAAIAVVGAAALAFLLPAIQLYQRYAVTERGCGDFVNEPAIFEANDRLCADHLLLTTIAAEQQWIVRNLQADFEIAPERFAAYLGTYRFDDGPPIEITRSGDMLVAQVQGLRAYALAPQSETRFLYRVLGTRSLTFELDSTGRAEALVLHSQGTQARARRIR